MADQAVWPMPGYPTDMGDVEQIYEVTGQSKAMMVVRLLLWMGIMVATGYLLVSAGSLLARTDDVDYGMAAVILVMLIAWFVWLSLPLLKRLRLYQSEAHDIAALCHDGMAYYHDGDWVTVRWNDIASVQSSRVNRKLSGDGYLWLILDLPSRFLRGHIRHYAIITSAEEWITLGETLTGIDELMKMIESKTWRLRLARAQQALQNGEDVRFGSITINKAQGLTYAGKFSGWETIDYIENVSENDLGDGIFGDLFADTKDLVRIKHRHTHQLKGLQSLIGIGDITIPRQDVPNADVLSAVSSDIIRRARASESQGVAFT